MNPIHRTPRHHRLNTTLACLLLACTHLAYANKAVVLNSKDASLTLIDESTGKFRTITGIGKEPHHLYPSPDGKQLWIANAQSDDLIKINPETGAVLQRVKGIADPYQLAFSNDGKLFVAISLRLNRVDIYAHQTAAAVLNTPAPMPAKPIALPLNTPKNAVPTKPVAATPATPTLKTSITPAKPITPALVKTVATTAQDGQFKLLKRIPTGSMPSHTAFSLDQKTIYVTLQGDNQLIAIDLATQTIAWTVPVGKTPAGVWVTPQGMVLVGIMGEDYVQVIDPKTRTTIKKITTGNGAHAFRGRGDGKTVFVSNRDSSSISAIDMTTLTKSYDIRTDSGPDCMDVSADGKTLWVTNRWQRKVSAIDIASTKTLKQFPVGNSPHGVYLMERAPLR
jgi:YVTN family beta-propeller protein